MADTPPAASYDVSSKTADVVAILRGDTLAQVIPLARPMVAQIFDVSELMEHPLETGAQIADHIVRRPVEIQMPVVIAGDFAASFASLRQLYLDGVILTVQTRTRSYGSMVLLEIPHDETADASDAITVVLKFREANFIAAVYGGLAPAQVKSKPKASTARRGNQQTTTTNAARTAAAADQYRGSTLYRLTR